jgi:hypothetical protein
MLQRRGRLPMVLEALKSLARSLLALGPIEAGLKTLAGPDDKQLADELKNYAAHAAILTQVSGFITQIMATITFYVTVTGAVWGVAASDPLNIGQKAITWILGMHIALSLGVAVSLRGLGNNLIQRLEFARLMGERFWPDIVKMGRRAWGCGEPVFTLRTQRFWFVAPVLAIGVSVYLLVHANHLAADRRALCEVAAQSLAIDKKPPQDHALVERDRYAFDKAGCGFRFLAAAR